MFGRQNWPEIVVTLTTVILLLGTISVNLLPRHRVSTMAQGSMQPASALSWVQERPRFILFGDSLTERSYSAGGWGSSLAHTYLRKADVLNRGYGGYNTQWALLLMDKVFKGSSAENTPLVTLFFGANDAAIPLPEGTTHSARQHVPLAQYKENLKHMIADLRARGLTQIVVMCPPPVYEPGRREAQQLRLGAEQAKDLPLDRTNAFTKQYAEACHVVAAEVGVPAVDLWTSMQQEQDWGTKLFNDGLHFTVEGNQHVYEALQKTIDTTFPSLKGDALPMQFPAWDAIDPSNPANSLSQP